jgi:type IV pilus assembly protein PilO
LANVSLAKLPWKVQLGVFVALSLAGAGGFYYFYEMPTQEQITAREQDLGSINARLDKGRATARKLNEFRREVTELEARLESLKAILPDEKDAADLLRRVNTLALQSSLTIRGFRPQAISTQQIHAEWPITLELEGTYHNLGTFLDRVSKFPRIINVGGLDIRGRKDTAPGATVEVTCTATTFVLLDNPTPAPAPAKKGAAAAPKRTE